MLKPSERDPGAALLLAAMAKEAGLPDGVLNIVHGGIPTVDFLSDAPEIKVGCGVCECGYGELGCIWGRERLGSRRARGWGMGG